MKFLYSTVSLIVSLTILVCTGCTKESVNYSPDIYQPDNSFKVVGYLSVWNFGKIDYIELNRLTYLNLAFGNPDKYGNIVMDDNVDPIPVITKAHAAKLKVFISLSGGGSPDTEIWKTLLLPGNRSSFIKSIVAFVERYNLDGVDVDIEGNLLPYIGQTYNPFVIELRKALHIKGKGMSAALGAVGIDNVISQKALEAYDFINVMVYDKTGMWMPEVIGPHSPYSFAEEAIKFWTVDKKIPASHITLGVPFYGFDFTPPARYIDYSEIIKDIPALAYQDSAGLRYYNGIPTIVKKTELAKKTLGGIMIWELGCDTKGDLSLLRALDQTLKAGNCEVKTFYKDEDGDGYGNLSKPFESCSAPAGYVSNSSDSDDTNPIIHP